ncbi:alkaline phosphatase [Geodermatophilus marinus]|uniref:alkaline phosphatase n=1 Tax=Geodermatophilus sp. LHW52908 TaxID=2303986 RepID=UPI001F359D53|nr:alkaline phosphatase [Geodermatophilus sp. LHW52908]
MVLVVGDGMGPAHREAARLALAGTDGELAMGSLPVAGLQTTIPADPSSTVTDSAAAATAWATGEKTANGSLAVGPDGERLTPLGREAAEAGLATGLVTTSAVTDATPAAFFSSVADREDQDDVAEQYLTAAGPSVVLGGGAGVWDDGLLDRARADGATAVTDADRLASAEGDRLLGLFAEGPLHAAPDPEVSLAELTRVALDRLSADPDGFFLVVEEEQVDEAGHANDDDALLTAMASLDEAVEVAREHAEDHPGTLLVVTGDHETGGLAVEDADPGADDAIPVAGDDDRAVDLDWSTESHTAAPTPVTATGPGSEQLSGTYPNTHLHEVMREVLLG